MAEENDPKLRQLLVRPGATIRAAMEAIDAGAVAIALLVAEDGQLLGTVTDGDLRRALLDGFGLDDSVENAVNRSPKTVPLGTERSAVLDCMRAQKLSQIPEVDTNGCLVRLHVMHEILGTEPKSNTAFILAGGRGSRLGELTRATPKPMLKVAGTPILERLVLHLVGSGISRIVLSVGYLGHVIQDHFGNGEAFGCSIRYVEEDPTSPLGTGGPLLRLPEQYPEGLKEPILVLNGDLLSSFSVHRLLAHHEKSGAEMTVALSQYRHEVPFGVIRMEGEDGKVSAIEEKPQWSVDVNAGIYVVNPELIDWIPEGVFFPVTDLIQLCLNEGVTVSGWSLEGDWHDIGRPSELASARGEV